MSTTTETRFYVELPADEGGSTALAPAVIEGRIVQGGTPEANERHFTNPARQVLLFDAPAEVGCKYGGMYTDAYGGYAEVAGPARLLDRGEYDTIVTAIRANAGSPS